MSSNRSIDRNAQEELDIMVDACCKPILSAHQESSQAIQSSQEEDDGAALSDYDRLQQEHHKALGALRQLAEGVRIVTRQMKHQHLDTANYTDDETSVASSCQSIQPVRSRTLSAETAVSACSEDDRRLHDLVTNCYHHPSGVVGGADLLGLSQAAQMVNEHARLASHEASILTDDMTVASRTADDAVSRATRAEKVAKRASRENGHLKEELAQCKLQRKVLAREVKALRKENAALRAFQQEYQRNEMLLALENHVRGALVVHEEQLSIAKKTSGEAKEATIAEEEDVVEDVAAEKSVVALEQPKTKTEEHFVKVSKALPEDPVASKKEASVAPPKKEAPKKAETAKPLVRSSFGGSTFMSIMCYDYAAASAPPARKKLLAATAPVAAPKEAKEPTPAPTKKKETPPIKKKEPLARPVSRSMFGFGGGGFPIMADIEPAPKKELVPSSLGGVGGFKNSKRTGQPLKISKKANEPKITLDTTTCASTAITETMAPEKTASSPTAADENKAGNKENVTKSKVAPPTRKKQSSGTASTFTSFFGSRSAKVGTITTSRPPSLNLDEPSATPSSSQSRRWKQDLTIDSTHELPAALPSTVTLNNRQALLSPFSEDSPVGAFSAGRLTTTMDIQCDPQVYRSLSLPDEESSVTMDAPPYVVTRMEAMRSVQ